MPTNIRAGLSVIVALAVTVAFYFEQRGGAGSLHLVVLALGVLMIGAVWLFPEAKSRDD